MTHPLFHLRSLCLALSPALPLSLSTPPLPPSLPLSPLPSLSPSLPPFFTPSLFLSLSLPPCSLFSPFPPPTPSSLAGPSQVILPVLLCLTQSESSKSFLLFVCLRVCVGLFVLVRIPAAQPSVFRNLNLFLPLETLSAT